MRKIYLLLTLCCAMMACKHNNVDFTYSPAAPRAGQSVVFTNQSSSGEEWSWTYGDGAVASIKSPSHIYKQPGTYSVTLKVDNKNKWTATKQITVYDTIPTFACSDSDLVVYKDYTFSAVVYNPYNYDVKYEWYFPINTVYTVVTDTTMTGSSLHLYFIQAMNEAPIGLRVTLNGETTVIEKTFEVSDRKTNSVLIRTDDADYRQRIFGKLAEAAIPTTDTAVVRMLDHETDTMQVYNKDTFTLSEIAAVFPGIEGFHIASRKIYYRYNGLWVANIDGAYQVQIDAAPCSAMTLDTKDSRIYWANAEGVWYMPFIGSDNNKFVTVPTRLNTLSGVTKIAADKELK